MRPLGGGATNRRGRVAIVAGVVVLLVAGALVAGFLVGSSPPVDQASAWPTLAQSSSFVTVAGSWAIVPMGDLNQPVNTFWQIFFRRTGTSTWELVTPPGVADNGGLAATQGQGGEVTVAFDPTNLLTFSPFASTSDNGATWAHGVIPFGIASVPDALVAPSSKGGALSALEHGGAGVQSGTGAQPEWAPTYTVADLARSAAGRLCGVTAITAVAGSGSDQVVGATCAKPGVVGMFRAPLSPSGTWQLVGPDRDAAGTRFDVLRLSATGGHVDALVDGLSGHGSVEANALYGMWGDGEASGWSTSSPLSVPPHTRIVSSGFGEAGSVFVETKTTGGALSASVSKPGSDAVWTGLPRLPAGAETVSLGSTTTVLSVGITVMTEWQLDGSSWARTGSVEVPIQFGSSS